MRFHRWRFLLSMLVLVFFVLLFCLHGASWILPRKAAFATQLSTDITHVGGKLALALILLTVTVAFGRWYCVLLCPAGAVQDLFSRLGRAIGLSRLRFARPPFAVNVIALVAAILFGGVVLLDPMALFAWLALMPGGLTNHGWWGLERLYSSIPAAVAVWVGVVLLLAVVPLFAGRVFCDVLCPVGTLLRLVARLPGKRLAIAAEKCVSCGRCEAVCPARCVDAKEKTIDSERCLSCFDCVGACNVDALVYRYRGMEGRRGFMAGVGAGAAGAAYVAARSVKERLGVAYADEGRVAPPGAGGQIRHTQRCVGCQACVLACPAGILRADGIDVRPVMDYRYGYCQYYCIECSASCPAGVFEPIAVEVKQTTRVAEVALLLDRCVVRTRGHDCGACAEVCPTHAVTMVEQGEGMHTIPDFKAEYCIGCGACYHVCPSEPRAFSVKGLRRHERSAGIRPTDHDYADDRLDGDGGSDAAADFPF